ncbi:MAG: TonB-dependent receptor [Gammaproteobacteria bacterium]|nr:TonB-dependent receptor [Gammaproteobacteria bacterium]MBU2676546.1 TonB-dependent receptor [Gammaproteobacteria bacterium]NNC57522.1 TonB-dependent receptor [Woeseiaceae bacterium]NNL50282.1 TonB-dependent receptor [Woeseiaceae bacterium]
MNNKSRFSRSALAALKQSTVAMFAAMMLLAVPVAGNAQETTTAIRGTVTAPDGTPAAGQSITVRDTRTGSVRRVTTNNNGAFDVRGLPVGGPYTIRVQSTQYQGTLVTDVFTNLSAAVSFDLKLGPLDETIEEIVTTARMVATADLAIGPGTSFSLEEIESMPSIARQIRDVIRTDPRVSLGRADNGAGSGINCLGGSSRSNAFTIDGSLAIDGFGLNEGTGTSARFAFPIPFDTVASTSVEFAPLDVQYSQFTGCAINVVTKPGSNEFHGSAFYLYNDEELTGNKLEGDTVINDPFEDKNFGFDLSGPIIKDTLFFTVAYEETDEGGVQNSGPIGGGFANEDWLTVADANTIAGILLNQYGRDVGPIVRTLPQTSERTFARLDWNINDEHRAELTYTKLEELNLDPDDLGFGGFTFRDNFEFEGIEQDTVSFRLFSNWSDSISSEFRYSKFDVTDIQGPAGGGEAQDPNPIERIEVGDFFTSGPGFFRSANDLQYTIDQLKLSADWVVGDHTLTAGFEQETRDIFNLFIPDATGTIVFDDVAALQAGTASEIVMNGSFTKNPSDAAAAFEREINSFYLQDEWQVSDSVTLIAGVRYDEYGTNINPILNPVFQARYGFPNNQTFEGLELVQPRLGMTWDLPTSRFGETQLTAGFGVFGGGDPTVHFANAYQNFGGAIGFGASFFSPCVAADLQVTDASGQFTGLPECVRDAAANSANANTGAVAAVDPNFDLPSNHRWSIGLNHIMESDNEFLNDWTIRADFIYTDHKDAVDWVDLRLTPNGVTLPDGRPQFFEVDPTLPGCNATFNGIRQGFSNAGTNGGPCDDTRNQNQDVLMTNGVEGSTASISLQLAKEFNFSDKTSLDFGLGYAWLDAEAGNPVNSSTAGSSYEEVAKITLNNNTLGPALWANEHNIVLRARFKHYFFDDHATSVGLFFQRRSGRPFSYAYEDDTVEEYFGDSDDESSILIYVPTGPSDPLMDFSNLSSSEIDGLFAFLDESGLSQYAGGIAPKNGFNSPWSTDLDIRIQQDLPMWKDHSLQVFFDIENVLNLLSDRNNVKRYADTDDIQEAVRVLEINERDPVALGNTDQFVITRWYDEGTNRDVDDSVYRIQLGVRYKF